MNEEKWTSGPWVYEPTKDNFPVDAEYDEYDEYGSCGGSIMSGDVYIARIWADVSENKEEYIANAHLIKAAPKMYDALSAVEWVEEAGKTVRFCPECKRYEAFGHYPGCKLDAALKKARGEK